MLLIILLITILSLTIDAKPALRSLYERNKHILNIIHGDILMTEEDKVHLPKDSKMSLFVNDNGRNRWPGNVVYYKISGQYSSSERRTIKDALHELEQKSGCFKFVERTSQQNYVHIEKADGCYAAMGKKDKLFKLALGGAQIMSLDYGCVYKHIIQHEFMHAIGIHHEHQRNDRDKYIRVNWNNVEEEWQSQLEKVGYNGFSTAGFKYDVRSIMHYDGRSGSRDGSITMKDLKTGKPTPDNHELTREDIQKLHYIGNCKSH